MRLLAVIALCAITSVADAQSAKRPAAKRASATVQRKGTAEDIERAGAGLSFAMRTTWPGGGQEMLELNGCVATITSKKTVGDLVTDDRQTFDAADLSARMEPNEDLLASTWDLRFPVEGGASLVTRTRQRTIEGEREKPVVAKIIFLALSVPARDPKNEASAMSEAMVRYQIACERVAK